MWKIQKYRMSKKMTQETLAEAIDVTPSYVSEIENSKKRPSLKTLQKIADVLGVPLVALMDDGPEVEQKKDVFVQCPFISYMDSPSALAEVSGITKEIFSVVTELPVEEKIKVLSYARDLKKLSDLYERKRHGNARLTKRAQRRLKALNKIPRLLYNLEEERLRWKSRAGKRLSPACLG